MKTWQGFIIVLVLVVAAVWPSQAQQTPVASPGEAPVTVEYYYRVKWGELDEFVRLYYKNHQPLLDEMKKLGYVRSTRMHAPFTHMAGGTRWDLRVTIVYRDAKAALADPEMAAKWMDAQHRIYKDSELFSAEERTRFRLLEDHWDVVVNDWTSE